MNSFQIIIQETKSDNGLETVFSTLISELDNSEIKETLVDERDIPSQAGDKVAFIAQTTKSYKVFSLIEGMSDIGNRSGYYIIHLYCPKSISLPNFERILFNIQEKYLSYPPTKTQDSQNYNDLLSAIIFDSDTNNYVVIKNTSNYFCYYDKDNSNLGTIFNSKEIFLVNKIYAFQRPKEEKPENFDFKPFSGLQAKIKEIEINGDIRLLNKITINNQSIDFNSRLNNLVVLSFNNDKIEFIPKNNAVIKSSSTAGIIIEEKKQKKTPIVNPNPPKKTFMDKHGLLLIGCLLSLFIGFGISYQFFPRIIVKTETIQSEPNAASITFIVNKDGNDSTYTAEQRQFEKYTFKYANNKWYYKNNQNANGYVDLYTETIKTFEYDNIIFTDIDQKMLIEALNAKSNYKIENKPKIDSNNSAMDSIKKTDKNKVAKGNLTEAPINNRKESKNKSENNSNASAKEKSSPAGETVIK